MKPIKLDPVLKNYLWGGERLKELYPSALDEPLAESWLLSVNKDGETFIINETTSKKSLKDYLIKNKKVVGKNNLNLDFFPILIKLIDAKQNLSVQVHPDDDFAKIHEGSLGKSEMWYVLDSNQDSFIYYGFKKDTSLEELKLAIENNSLEELLNKVYTNPGDIFYIPAGRVHAIGSGNLIAEIQQNSNITYRLYDYDRVDASGEKRELHLEKALLVTDLKKSSDKTGYNQKKHLSTKNQLGSSSSLLCSSEYFNVQRVDIESSFDDFVDDKSFKSLVCISGEGKIIKKKEVFYVSAGDSYFLPANMGAYKVDGQLSILITSS